VPDTGSVKTAARVLRCLLFIMKSIGNASEKRKRLAREALHRSALLPPAVE